MRVETARSEGRTAEEIVLEFLPDIVTLCNRMLRQRSDAQDATHEAALAILRRLPTYRGEGPLRHWVLKVALNAARQHRRSLSRRTRRERDLPAQEAASMPTNPAEAREEQEALRAAIAALPEQLREPIVLHYHHGLTQTEVAEALGCSQKTVSVRLSKGRERLQRELAGSALLAGVLAAGAAGVSTLDAVPASLVASVKQVIAGYTAASAAASTSAVSASAAGGSSVTTTLATGGLVMQGKLIMGAAALTIAGLVGGVVLSDRILGAEREDVHRAALAAAEQRATAASGEIEALRERMEASRRRSLQQVEDLAREARRLREQVAERDAALAALREAEAARESAAAAGSTSDGATREERWSELRGVIAPVLDILRKMDEAGANPLALGPQLVAELGRLSPEDYAAIVAFDAEETDPDVLAEIRLVMIQAMVFVPSVGGLRDDFMKHVIERTRDGTYGEDFTVTALRRLSFQLPPYVDRYAKIVAPLAAGLRGELVDMAVDRAVNGTTDDLRADGIIFLRRVEGTRATDALVQAAQQPTYSAQLRVAALRGLAMRAAGDEKAMQTLRDTAAADQDASVREAAARLVETVEKAAETR